MPRELRPQFDPTADFYVTRVFKAGGRQYLVDELFDKSLVETRRLRQMYDQRMLRQVAPTKPKSVPPPAGPATDTFQPVRRRTRREAA